MSFVETIEVARSSSTKRRIYFRIILSVLALMLIVTAVQLWSAPFGAKPRELIDFNAFYIAGQLVWRGEIEKAYRFATMSELQQSISGTEDFLPWTYPPPFDLLVAPLALLPLGLAYALFTAGTLTVYLATLRRIAAENFVPVLILIFPAILITVKCGQNGFLTGVLIGLTCLGLQARTPFAGVPLGLMVIKPHLAVAFAVYTLVNRRWGAALVAAGTMAANSALATLLLGPDVWIAFFDSLKEAQVFLENGFYQLVRMISVYAAVRTFGFSSTVASAAQAFVAIFALAAVIVSSRRLSLHQSLGVTAIASLLISPYAYDYDLPILGIGLAFLLPDLTRLGTEGERFALYALSLLTCGLSIAQIAGSSASSSGVITDAHISLSLAGLALVAILGLTWRILARSHASGCGRLGSCGDLPACSETSFFSRV